MSDADLMHEKHMKLLDGVHDKLRELGLGNYRVSTLHLIKVPDGTPAVNVRRNCRYVQTPEGHYEYKCDHYIE